jgi:hypothetical protein
MENRWLVTAYHWQSDSSFWLLLSSGICIHSKVNEPYKIHFLSRKSIIPRDITQTFSGYFIQFCIIACFLWLTVMWIDICIHAWYYLPRGIKQTPKDDNLHLMYYSLFAFGLSLILVILTYKNKLSGLPSYYIKGSTKGAYKSIDTELIFEFCMFMSEFVIFFTSFHPPSFLLCRRN